MSRLVEMIKECLQTGGDLNDTLTTIWLDQEAQGKDLSHEELNVLVIKAVKEMK